MTEPEIARRCLSCGASVRVRAFFCPQCGNELGPKHDPADYEDAKTEPLGPVRPELTSDGTEPAAGKRSDSERTTGVAGFTGATRELPGHRTRHTVPGAAERDVMGDAHGVERLRQISSAVLDEASYDPSLRFVLVAAVLFILFLVLLIASELIT